MAMDMTKHSGVRDMSQVPYFIAMIDVIHDNSVTYTDDKGNTLQASGISFEVVDENGKKVGWIPSNLWNKVDNS